ncbi:DUF4102 domain-containing protein [Luteimonas sp. MC1572]|nr:DUF4102 domain-containing protein [Luteimonas sp. MC1572]QQO04259.1 DUF4102 domain-containing protein [Luteimonas sp. MC1572]
MTLDHRGTGNGHEICRAIPHHREVPKERSPPAARVQPSGLRDEPPLPGFAICVTAKGSISFRCVYTTKTKESRRYVFGHWPALSAAAAREVFLKLRKEIELGGDPAAAKVKARKDAEEARERDKREITVPQLSEKYIAEHAKRKRSGAEDVRRITPGRSHHHHWRSGDDGDGVRVLGVEGDAGQPSTGAAAFRRPPHPARATRCSRADPRVAGVPGQIHGRGQRDVQCPRRGAR